MKKRKVVLLDIFYLLMAQTGIKTYTETLIEVFQHYPEDDFQVVVYPSLEKIQKITFFKGRISLWKRLLFQLIYHGYKLTWLPIKSHLVQARVVINPDILSNIWGKGTIVQVHHDTFLWDSPEHYNPTWLKGYLRLLHAAHRRGRAAILTISEFSKERLGHIFPKAKSIDTIYPSVHLGLNNKAATPSPISDLYLLHVGVFEKRKNLVSLIEAFYLVLQKSPDLKLVLVGQSAPKPDMDASAEMEATVQRLGLEDRVIYTGYLSQQALQQYYQHAAMYVFPSKNEGFGVPILEAFYHRLPVVISPQGALKEIGDAGVYVAAGYEPKALAAAIDTVLSDEQLQKGLIIAGQQRLTYFSQERYAKDLYQWLRKL